MIKLCGKEIKVSHFPDNTQNLHIPIDILRNPKILIEWKYESDEEMATLLYIAMRFKNRKKDLILSYIPNARMDRVKNPDEIFTLKYFCEFINSLKFEKVYVLDPHSDVSTALLNNVSLIDVRDYIFKAIDKVDREDIIIFFPDNGAAKRYSGMIGLPYCYGSKNRDWRTGEILGLDIITNGLNLDGKDILIVDDICSKGGTFYHSALKLKECGVNNIYLYVTHCENTIAKGELLKDNGLIEKVFTTNSIYTLNEKKVEVLK